MNSFERIALGIPGSLYEAALSVAVDEYPDLDVPTYIEQMQLMIEGLDIFLAGESQPAKRLHLLNDFFFDELDFSGNTTDYYDPRNSYVNEVVDRRLGIPISLSLVYGQLAESIGIQLAGVNMPGHFLLAHRLAGGKRIYIDVFGGGRWLDWRECKTRLREFTGTDSDVEETDFPAMSDREVLVRMLRNLKSIYSRSDFGRCVRVQERLIRLLPDEPHERRDLGISYYHAGKPALAMRTLERLVTDHPTFGTQNAVRDYLKRSTREAVLLN